MASWSSTWMTGVPLCKPHRGWLFFAFFSPEMAAHKWWLGKPCQNCLESTESTVVVYYFTVTGNNYGLVSQPVASRYFTGFFGESSRFSKHPVIPYPLGNVCQGLLPKGECHHWQVFFLLKRFFLLSAQPNVRLASNFQQDLLLFGQWFQAFCYLVASYPFKVTKDFSKWLSWCRPGLNLPGGFFVHSICWRAFQHYKCW